MTFVLDMIRLGLTNLRLHLLRSVLTALGIILGIAAVIIMVSIGEGSKLAALSNLEALGAKNIIIRSQKPPESSQQRGGQERSFMLTYGLTRDDERLLREVCGSAEQIVALKEVGNQILKDDRRQTSQTFGTTPEILDVTNLKVARGRYLTQRDLDERAMVAVIGSDVAKQMFPFEDPLGATLRIDDRATRVIGVLQPVGLAAGAGTTLVGRDLNLDVHIPITTASLVFGDVVLRTQSGSFQAAEVQVSDIYIAAPDRESVLEYAAVIRRLLASRHPQLTDVSIKVPFELLEQARRTAITYGAILAAIAAVSLIVGGIGIMNIMLASVTERTREIGIRRALGATRRHILTQFLIETSVLSTLGGIIGVVLGVGVSGLLDWAVPRLHSLAFVGDLFAPDLTLPTQVTAWSVVVAFIVAAATGIVFGLYPALQAARQDPIVALRHD